MELQVFTVLKPNLIKGLENRRIRDVKFDCKNDNIIILEDIFPHELLMINGIKQDCKISVIFFQCDGI